MSSAAHWESIYQAKGAERVSWYRPHLERSLEFIDGAGATARSAIIDVGGGASTLVDDLLDRGYSRITVLDLSATAIQAAKDRLGARAGEVQWIVGDVCALQLPEHSV